MERIRLNNRVSFPTIGIGTWKITDTDLIFKVLSDAYELGYRLIDTAAAYGNEIMLAKAMRKLNIQRSEIFIQDKVWNTNRGYKETQEACKKSLKKLKTDYIDAYLIHWPASPKLYENWEEINAETWRGMEQLYKEGYVRAIGVCNYKIHHLHKLLANAAIIPQINQVELHPGLTQKELIDYCQEKNIFVEASSPLGNGQILDSDVLKKIAEQHKKTTAQICLRWGIEKRCIVLPKTTSPERLKENISVFDFSLTDEETKKIDKMSYCGGLGIDSDEVIEFG
ncbi:MAG: aldo/keto reductase [Lachnospiraceae bacterium]|nr:aldo/keto reductase [Lachnospiraceae bacterium]